MGFEKIGPYELTRSDQVVASLVISFFIGSTSFKIKCSLYVLLGIVLTAIGIAIRDAQITIFGPIFILFIFVVSPALRSTKYGKNLYLEYSPEGIIVDSTKAKTTYKWETIISAKKIGSRLFIMIYEGVALVVSDRSTSRANMDNLMATITRHKDSETF